MNKELIQTISQFFMLLVSIYYEIISATLGSSAMGAEPESVDCDPAGSESLELICSGHEW